MSLDSQSEYPDAKAFSITNLWYMKKWYRFDASGFENELLQQLVGELEAVIPASSNKLAARELGKKSASAEVRAD
ncbi:hypothetical protein [Adlercreutzia sp. ZJ138]|uniref:hypothetical protein n=1 Tax=Adlercreutzia sp. ZJ138 TaxID=2709405 RepID=UPI001F14D476|nr:hypothetical protein [Adlercreutzia sp. ZJ138]